MRNLLSTTSHYASLTSMLLAVGLVSGLSANPANAAKTCEDGSRPPCNDAGGGNKPDNPGGGKPSNAKGDLYSDLVVLLRDEYGRPILTDVDGVSCLQPISAAPVEGLDETINPADGKSVSLIPLGGTGIEGEECDVDPDYAAFVQEVLFGRLNLGRAPERVLRQQLREVTSVLASSIDPIEIDEAGRFVVYLPEGTEIDSPGNNLAMHKELQVEGVLLSPTNVPIILPPAANDGILDHAAAALGAAAGKGDFISLDLVVYNNRILDIPNDTKFTTITGDAGEKYFDYTDYGYTYNRSTTFPGCVRGQLADFPVPGDFTPFSGTIMDCVFGSIEYDELAEVGICSNGEPFIGETAIHRFAQRADDARAVIAFVHGNAVADSTAILPADQAGVDRAGQDLVCEDIAGQAP